MTKYVKNSANEKANEVQKKDTFDEALAFEILERISCSPMALDKLCAENPHWPCAATIHKWRLLKPEFGQQFMYAKQCQIEPLVDSIHGLLEDTSNDFYEDRDGRRLVNHAHIQKIKLKIDSIKWQAAKLAPKIYGERIVNETNVTVKHEDALKELE